MYMYIICMLSQELERAFIEARTQLESGAVDYGGDSEEEQAPEVSMHDSCIVCSMYHSLTCTMYVHTYITTSCT